MPPRKKAPRAGGANTGNLKPAWKPGQSGNPSGRPKQHKVIASVAQDGSEKAIKRLVKLIDSSDERIALSAAQAVLDRAIGKPIQSINTTIDDRRELRELSGSELEERASAALRRIEELTSGTRQSASRQDGSSDIRKLN